MAANPSTKNAHEQLIARLLANLPTGYTASTVEMPNYPFTTPSNTKWMRATPIEQVNTNVQAGINPWQRKEGLFVVDIFYPLGAGGNDNVLEAEQIQALFQNKSFGGVDTQEALIEIPGKEDSWYHTQVSIDYTYEGITNG